MKLILHVGAHGTGALALQACIHSNSPALAAAGISALCPEQIRNGMLQGLIPLRNRATPQTDQIAHRSAGRLKAAFARQAAAGVDRMILSEANILGTPAQNLRRAQLYPDAGWRLRRFRPAAGAGLRRIVLSIRCYDSWWVAQLAGAVAAGRAALPDPARLDRLVTQPRRWRHLISELQDVFTGVEIMVLPYERFAGQPARALARLADVPVNDLRQTPHHETGPAPQNSEIARLLTASGQDNAAGKLRCQGGGRWNPFPADHRAALRDQYAEDLAWLRDGAGQNVEFIDDMGRRPHRDEDRRGQEDGCE